MHKIAKTHSNVHVLKGDKSFKLYCYKGKDKIYLFDHHRHMKVVQCEIDGSLDDN